MNYSPGAEVDRDTIIRDPARLRRLLRAALACTDGDVRSSMTLDEDSIQMIPDSGGYPRAFFTLTYRPTTVSRGKGKSQSWGAWLVGQTQDSGPASRHGPAHEESEWLQSIQLALTAVHSEISRGHADPEHQLPFPGSEGDAMIYAMWRSRRAVRDGPADQGTVEADVELLFQYW